MRWVVLVLLGSLALTGASCTTTYDAHGRPVQSVDPAAAAIGAVAIGVAGYAIGHNNSDNYHGHHKHHGHHKKHHRPPHHRRH